MEKNYFLEVREKFFDFWQKRGHFAVPSSSLVPDDPSVLLTTAGMQQFKRYYTGELSAERDFGGARTTSIQKCFRTSDIDEVGDKTHLTFFEMMGNFSFGPVGSDDPDGKGVEGYFKKAAIVWAYQFIVEVLKIESERLYVTVFGGDEQTPKDKEAYAIWYDHVGISKDRIFEGNREDNFWGPTGSEGPCGPTTELYVAASSADALANKGVEVWNVVFNEYYKNKDGAYEKVEAPGIDTGMGFERLLAVLEGVSDVFATSSFVPLMAYLQEHGAGLSQRDLRVLADHIRGSVFLISDGVVPSNKETGYILRRLLRRVIGIKIKEGISADLFAGGLSVLVKQYGDIYEGLKKEKEILQVWNEELSKFEEAIGKGIVQLEKLFEKSSSKVLSAADAFDLYATHGLSVEIVKDFAAKNNFELENFFDQYFEERVQKHQDISRAGVEKKFGGHGLLLDTGELKAANEDELRKVLAMHTATHLLQWALRQVLGGGIGQMGSDINVDRLRFDFSFDRKMSDEEKKQVEDLINKKIDEDLPVYFKEMSKEEAEREGALAFFKEKYPDVVKVYYIGSDEHTGVVSKELCGGPHVSSTGKIGKFILQKEESVGKGVRRIRATVAL